MDALGHMTLNEDGAVVSSGGDMSNDEQLAERITTLVRSVLRLHANNPHVGATPFRRLSVIWEEYMYVITVSNHKIYAFKRRTDLDEAPPTVVA